MSQMRKATYAEAVQLLHRTREALVLSEPGDDRAFGLLRNGIGVGFMPAGPLIRHTIVPVRPCAAWPAEDGDGAVIWATHQPEARPSILTKEQFQAMSARVAEDHHSTLESWEDALALASGLLMDVVDEDAMLHDGECERWARSLVEGGLDRHLPPGAVPTTFAEAVDTAERVLAALGFATHPDGVSEAMGVARLHDPQERGGWFVSHGTGETDERDVWRAGLVDQVLRRCGFITFWMGDPRQTIEVKSFRPSALA